MLAKIMIQFIITNIMLTIQKEKSDNKKMNYEKQQRKIIKKIKEQRNRKEIKIKEAPSK